MQKLGRADTSPSWGNVGCRALAGPSKLESRLGGCTSGQKESRNPGCPLEQERGPGDPRELPKAAGHKFCSDLKYLFLEFYSIKLSSDYMLGLFAGERENDVLMHLLPLAQLLSELVQCSWVGVKALEQCPGAGRVTWLCSGPWVIAQRPPSVWGEGRWSLFHHPSTRSTSSQGLLATVSS